MVRPRKVIELLPCPFCDGPPCLDAQETTTGLPVFARHRRKEHEHFSAVVWCHECGCQGPVQDSLSIGVFEDLHLTVDQLLRRAARHWNDRHAKARALYNSAQLRGLNQYPRGTG